MKFCSSFVQPRLSISVFSVAKKRFCRMALKKRIHGRWFLFGREASQSLGEIALVEKRFGDETLFLHEPAKDEARDEADDAEVVVAVGSLGASFRKRTFFSAQKY
jgi:hypothetical protein